MKKYSLLVVSLLAFTIAVEAKKKEVYDAMEELNPLKVQRITRRLLGDLTNKNISDFITFADQVLEEQKKNLSLLNSWRDCAKIAVGGGLLVGALYYAKMLLSGDGTSAYSRPMDSKEAARGSDSGLRGTGYQLPASAGYYQQGLTCGREIHKRRCGRAYVSHSRAAIGKFLLDLASAGSWGSSTRFGISSLPCSSAYA